MKNCNETITISKGDQLFKDKIHSLLQQGSKKILLGVLDLSDMNAETPQQVAARIRRALPHVDPRNVIVAPDCGMKYLPRDVADAKLRAMVEGARIVREELA